MFWAPSVLTFTGPAIRRDIRWNQQRSERHRNLPSGVDRGRGAFRMTLEGLDSSAPPSTGTLVIQADPGGPPGSRVPI
jgi:hypothetical protein